MRKLIVLLVLTNFTSFAQLKNAKLYESSGIQVKSYDFNSFEPFLKLDDDTTYVINFWATWCLPCVKELPSFEQINQKYKKDKVKVILVSLDMSKKVESNLIPFLLKKKMESEVIHLDDPDANSWIEKVDKNWSGAIPATYIYNKKSHMFYERSFTFEELEKEVLSILNK
ncbi:TlpA disulfide reductase family protein [Flavobacterium sp.]|uniref:TlpA disulfide reductase family protein n=1 Tax=Flavobacterium sp. TaxID=239 RepID=UPI003D6B5B6E